MLVTFNYQSCYIAALIYKTGRKCQSVIFLTNFVEYNFSVMLYKESAEQSASSVPVPECLECSSGPILFNVSLNDFFFCIQSAHIFADDILYDYLPCLLNFYWKY